LIGFYLIGDNFLVGRIPTKAMNIIQRWPCFQKACPDHRCFSLQFMGLSVPVALVVKYFLVLLDGFPVGSLLVPPSVTPFTLCEVSWKVVCKRRGGCSAKL
jgi:hypothetical protein